MTQEELDSLLEGGDIDIANNASESESNEVKTETINPDDFRVEAGKRWSPPPPTEDHKVVQQLDDVTRDTEVKGTQIFDQLEIMSNNAANIEKQAKALKAHLKSQEELFSKLCASFPHIESFQSALDSTKDALNKTDEIFQSSDDINNASMQAMDLMQYQDIHRQKIERVINVMRALAQYMNSLFEGKIDDSKRVGSAVFIAGDNNEDIASEEDIEALIASFGKKS